MRTAISPYHVISFPLVTAILLVGLVACVLAQPSETELRKRLNEAGTKARFELEQGKRSLRLTVLQEGGPSGYNATDVQAILIPTKSRFSERLAGDDLAPFRSYVEAFFPDFRTRDIRQEDRRIDPLGRLVSTTFADTLFSNGLQVAMKIERLGLPLEAAIAIPLSLNLKVVSLPNGARVTVQPLVGGRTYTTTSDSEFRNLYKGVYRYTVAKPGFQEIGDGEINLLDDDRPLQCSLRSIGDHSGHSACIRK